MRIPTWKCPNVVRCALRATGLGALAGLQKVAHAGAVGKALGKAGGGGWEEKSDTGIPGNVNLKGVSGKGAWGMDSQPRQDHGGTQLSGRGTFQPGCRELKEGPSERDVTTVPALGAAPRIRTHPRQALVNRNQYGGSSVSCFFRWFLARLRALGETGQSFCLEFLGVGRKRRDPDSNGGLGGPSHPCWKTGIDAATILKFRVRYLH